jgi:hypothetical protein
LEIQDDDNLKISVKKSVARLEPELILPHNAHSAEHILKKEERKC